MYVNTRALADAIRDSGMALGELAGRAGVPVLSLIYVDPLGRLPLGVLVRLAGILDMPLETLFGDRCSGAAEIHLDSSLVGSCLGDHPQGLTRQALGCR